MQTSDTIDTFVISETDLPEAEALLRSEAGATDLPQGLLKWWYFDNPFHAFSVFGAKYQGKLCGFSTINNFRFEINGQELLAGMPQKVVTSEAVRGKGLFKTLYYKGEEHNVGQGTDCFLTFTNAMSTPIFLGRFGYVRGLVPDVVLLPTNPALMLARPCYRVVKEINPIFMGAAHYGFRNAMKKDAAYFRWRYQTYQPEDYVILEVPGEGASLRGYVVLKKIKKRGIPFLLLMDLCARSREDIASLLLEARKFASRNFVVGMLLLDMDEFEGALGWIYKRFPNRLNFLLKGVKIATEELAKTKFRFFFGDLDFT